MRRLFLLLALLTACTPGGVAPSAGGDPATQTIDINLTLDPGGYAPDTVSIPVGSTIRFHNSDGFAHTASVLQGLSSFPASSPLTASATTQSGSSVSQPWTTGTLAAGAFSQIVHIDLPGTYLYACFYHYGAPMHGTIVAH